MTESEARALLAQTAPDRVCVRYVYDAASGRVVFGAEGDERSRIVPEHRLAARIKGTLAVAAAVAAPLLVEACGGAYGYDYSTGDPAMPGDAGHDAQDAGAPDARALHDAGGEAQPDADTASDAGTGSDPDAGDQD